MYIQYAMPLSVQAVYNRLCPVLVVSSNKRQIVYWRLSVSTCSQNRLKLNHTLPVNAYPQPREKSDLSSSSSRWATAMFETQPSLQDSARFVHSWETKHFVFYVCGFSNTNFLQSKVVSLVSNTEPRGQGVPIVPPGSAVPSHRLLRLAGIRRRYCNRPPHGEVLPIHQRNLSTFKNKLLLYNRCLICFL
jgi:hypothetical protein